MSPLDFYRDLISKGVPEAVAYEMAAKFEADQEAKTQAEKAELLDRLQAAAANGNRTARQARNQRYYEGKKRLKASETSESETPKTVSDEVKTVSDEAEPSRTCAQVVTLTSSLRSEVTQEANASFVVAPKSDDLEKPKTKPPKSSRGTRLPEDWQPTERDVQAARDEGLTEEEIERAAREFRNFWCAKSRDATRLNWSLVWQNRVGELGERKRRNGARLASRPAFAGGGGRGVEDFASIVARRRGYGSD